MNNSRGKLVEHLKQRRMDECAGIKNECRKRPLFHRWNRMAVGPGPPDIEVTALTNVGWRRGREWYKISRDFHGCKGTCSLPLPTGPPNQTPPPACADQPGWNALWKCVCGPNGSPGRPLFKMFDVYEPMHNRFWAGVQVAKRSVSPWAKTAWTHWKRRGREVGRVCEQILTNAWNSWQQNWVQVTDLKNWP